MELTDYCNGVALELNGWKAKFFYIAQKIDDLGSAEKQSILPNVEDIHMLLSELETRIDQLKHECPTEWNSPGRETDEAHLDMRGSYEDTMAFIGKAAPVSVAG